MTDEPSTRYICVKCGYRDRCEITQYGEGHENPPLNLCHHGLLDDVDYDQDRAVWELIDQHNAGELPTWLRDMIDEMTITFTRDEEPDEKIRCGYKLALKLALAKLRNSKLEHHNRQEAI
ncbi:MAG: hypothetical protein M0Q91_10145 [Methanoregula sp.]|jgi:hypothetical protein|nr:hypothetical protein [Methanoregula sp.]